ncbi:MAG TPA: Xaa-Pro peptidase family protein [Bryobacteraceae bacterium]|nr:Xaa-Pro peptidase family protein [Bryobacteraceae bacterium]
MTEFQQRSKDVSSRLPELKADCLLVSSSANVRYLSGFTGSNGLILLTPGETHFFTDPRYAIEASQNVAGKVHVVKGQLTRGAVATIKRKRLKKIAFESSSLHHDEYAKLQEELPLGASLVPAGKVIEERRMIKSVSEIATICESVRVNSEAYNRVLKRIRPGVREVDIAAEIEFQMKMLGAEKPSFDTIVAAGKRSALPHARPGGYRLGENELLLIDMGAILQGYCSDMTRAVHLGRVSRRVREMYRAVLEAQLAGVAAVRPGTTAGRVDAITRNVLKKHKLDKAFVHSTGHGLGLDIHEMPRLGRKDKTPLRAGMTITIEPGVYVEGVGGIRIEDTVLVTPTGSEILTPTSKEFVSL